ncbi:helix-turn-helix domain-containing protein [Anaeromicrobium sediminis]|uniref:HTH araC/xylS-type domain-containing protein n=1 Tax=Anaeromicrobium sediminis TaxID=1478221 RepID=A0A267MI33_9FIRM|nr:helix-turn-helix domain-containing protein [Anaeromicrobium sediminis]PAB59107.1 hypothetical protein CCE28_11350 [Anaeromicrobium sediminis]
MSNELLTSRKDLPIRLFVKRIINDIIHWHDGIEIIFVLKGSIHLSIGAETWWLKENDMVIHNIGETHRIHQTEEENQLLFLQIDTKFFKKYYPNINEYYFHCCSPENEEGNKEKFHILRKYIARIVFTINEYENSNEHQIQNLTKALLEYLVEHFDYIRASEIKNEMQIERYERIFEYVIKNYMNKISLQEIAKKEHISLYYLSHDIKEKSGYSFQEIITALRVDQAVKLLLGTDKKISQIALECGFSAPRYLNKYFTKYYNDTPIHFRKKNKREKAFEKHEELELSVAIENLTNYLHDYKGKKKYIKETKTIYLNTDSNGRSFHHTWKKDIYLGSAKKILMTNYQNYLKEMQTEIRFDCIKFSGLFEEMDAFHKDTDGNHIFYWNHIDEILNFFQKINIKPFISVHFVHLSNVHIDFFNRFLFHCIKEYGLKEIESWIFEVPNDKGYEEIIKVIQSISSKVKIKEEKIPDFNKNFLYDTIYMAPYIIHSAIHSKNPLDFIKAVDSIDFNKKINNPIFHGENGLMTINGLKKASYYAYYLLSRLGNEMIEKEKGYIITKKNNDFQILLYDYEENKKKHIEEKFEKHSFFRIKDEKEIFLYIRNLMGKYKITRYELNEKHGSIFDHWTAMGQPKELSQKEEKFLNRIVFPKVTFDCTEKSNKDLSIKLKPHGVTLITLEKLYE